MDKLEFENFDIEDNGQAQEDESSQNESAKIQASDEQAIELSNKIVKALELKAKVHNKSNPGKKVTITQLKKVYHSGANVPNEDKGLWAMARVNMFLRMKLSINNIAAATDSTKTFKLNDLIDISAGWAPSEEDFDLAREDIDKYGLSNFEDINSLYLEPHQKLNTWITWG
tara:strand:+ start:5095 stop:5607 length:513 start_codon:yes stop_codon:yes gene_type:complete